MLFPSCVLASHGRVATLARTATLRVAVAAITTLLAHCGSAGRGQPNDGPDAGTGVLAQPLEQRAPRTVGMWYSTWYANYGHYIWKTGHGKGSANQFTTDVSGDGKADAVVFFSDGSWYVAASNGDGFNNYANWATGHGKGSAKQFVADVTGDGRADAIVFFPDGSWYVAASNGSGFSNYSAWRFGHGRGSTNQLVADVTGDGKADAIVFFPDGSWYVAAANGTGFNNYSSWCSGHGVGSANQLAADVTGDGKADAIVFFSDGSWYVGASNGNGFNNYSLWRTEHGKGSSSQVVADVTSDGRADAITFFDDGSWYVAKSNGNGFDEPSLWHASHGKGSTKRFVADTQGSGTSAAVAYGDGTWKVLPSGYRQPNLFNTWEAWGINFLPRVNSTYRQYDTLDEGVVDEHLRMMADARVDFLLMDQTNNIMVDGGYIYRRSKHVCQRIKALRDLGASDTPRHATAVGGNQWSHDPRSVEQEAKVIWNSFVQAADCGGPENHFMLDGKPLLVVYADPNVRAAFEALGADEKTYAGRFTLKWAQGSIDSKNASSAAYDDESSFFGWAVAYDGSIPNNASMVVMPGWDNGKGAAPVSRYYQNVEGGYYTRLGWDRVDAVVGTDCTKPHLVVVNSFNEYAERTAVAPTDTSRVEAASQWTSPDLYWEITKRRIRTYRCE